MVAKEFFTLLRKGKVEQMETKLVTLVGQWLEVANMMMDPDMDQQVIADTLEGIEGDIEVKADGYGMVIRSLEMEAAALKGKKEYVKSILDQITSAEKSLNNHVESMKNRLMEAMIATGKDETGIKTDKFEFKFRTAGGVQKLECTEDVPDNFKKVIYENDEAKIREYLKDHDVEWARLLPRKKSLVIKGV